MRPIDRLLSRAGIVRTQREVLIVFAGCVALLTVGDLFHVAYGAIAYAHPGPLLGQAWWVPPGFALAAVGLVALAWPFAPFAVDPTRKTVPYEVAWFFGSYAATGIVGHR